MTLRVNLEIVPHGDEAHAYEIGRLDISNMSFGEVSEYRVLEFTPKSGFLHNRIIRHIRRQGAWELVRAVINALNLERP